MKDFNISKMVQIKMSVPHKSGDPKLRMSTFALIYSVQTDVELFNYIDKLFRSYKLGIL